MRRLLLCGAMIVTLLGTSCSSAEPSDDELLVFAAASLTDAFSTVAAAYEDAHPGVEVTLSFASSSSLRDQILEGAPADVFASANTATMDQVVAAGAARDPVPFAGNELDIAVPPGNPAGVTGLGDFADEDLLLGLCIAEAPCGGFARQALEKAGVVPAIDTDEPNVRALLTKVEAGELDAAIVYRTDVLASAGSVDEVAVPPEFNVHATYPIAALADAPHPAAAADFVTFVLSSPGQEIMERFGFVAP